MESTPQVIAHQERVAIVGFAASSAMQAPFDDESWDIWGLNQLWQQLPRWTLWFDMHPRHMIDRHPQHVAWMQQQTQPILMQQHYADIPTSLAYPKQEIVNHFGEFFTSSISWMLALAIAQGYKHIGIWGVDMMSDGEYAYQFDSCCFFLGWIRGAGIALHVPDDSTLLKGQGLYGYSWLPKKDQRPLRRLKRRQRLLKNQRDESVNGLHHVDGRLAELKAWEIGAEEAKRQDRLKALTTEREQRLEQVYSIDGALQEIGDTLEYEKHYGRGGG